jgi:hypothetical protein
MPPARGQARTPGSQLRLAVTRARRHRVVDRHADAAEALQGLGVMLVPEHVGRAS